MAARERSANCRGRSPRARWRSTSERLECVRRGCTARRRSRSSWRAERPGSSRLAAAGRSADATAPAAGVSGSHWPFASRTEKMRSFARDRSSSRRAPPSAASNSPASSASSSAFVFSNPQQRCVPILNGCVPSAIASVVGVDDEPRADRLGHLVAELNHFAELVGGVDVEQRKRNRARMERLLRQAQHHRRVLADRIEHDRPLELRHDLAQDVDAFRFERAQMIQARLGRRPSRVPTRQRQWLHSHSHKNKKARDRLVPGFRSPVLLGCSVSR